MKNAPPVYPGSGAFVRASPQFSVGPQSGHTGATCTRALPQSWQRVNAWTFANDVSGGKITIGPRQMRQQRQHDALTASAMGKHIRVS